MKEKNKNSSYEKDFYLWAYHQADLLRHKNFEDIDIIHLVEELESLGTSEASKLQSHLTVLLLHLLKIEFQPKKHTRSWDLSIKNARYHANRTLTKNPSLKRHLPEIFKDAYFSARLSAAQETGLSEETFPEKCPWAIEEILKEKD
jgi:hypothetical protein